MAEELDYMSDDFITQCLQNSQDLRPGLIKSHKEQRQHNLLKKKEEAAGIKKKPTEVLQAEVLEESLKQPINSSNKGFSMLEKMGFKSGMGLGKNSNGITEPIKINIKNNKQGLGHEKPKPLKKEKKLDVISETDYRALMSKKIRERENFGDLRRSQRVCQELDLKAGKNEPDEVWYWPLDESAKDEEKTDDDDEEEVCEISNEEKLESLTRYLRTCYNYCIWCKLQYEDEKDMEDCPGATRDDH